MIELQPARSSAIRGLQSYSLWILAALILGLVQALISISPLGISRGTADPRLPLELVYLGATLGACFGLLQVQRARIPLARSPSLYRLQFEVAGLATPCLVLALCTLAPWALSVGEGPPILAAATLCIHVFAVALLLLRVPGPPGLACLLMPLLTWVFPALVSSHEAGPLTRILRSVLDPTCAYALLARNEPAVPLLVGCLAPILGVLSLRAAVSSFQTKP